MVDPVLVIESGHSYEREAISTWLGCGLEARDPITNALLQHPIQLITNHTLRKCINEIVLLQARDFPEPASDANTLDDSLKRDNAQSLASQLLETKKMLRKLKEKCRSRDDQHSFNLSFAVGGFASFLTLSILMIVTQVWEQCICMKHFPWFSPALVCAASILSAALSGPCSTILFLLDISSRQAEKGMSPRKPPARRRIFPKYVALIRKSTLLTRCQPLDRKIAAGRRQGSARPGPTPAPRTAAQPPATAASAWSAPSPGRRRRRRRRAAAGSAPWRCTGRGC